MISLDTNVLVRYLVCDDLQAGGGRPHPAGVAYVRTTRLRLP